MHFPLLSWGGVELNPLLPGADDGDDADWSSRWIAWQRKRKCSEDSCPSSALTTTNTTCSDLGLNPIRRGGNPAPNRLSYCTAYHHLVAKLNNYLCCLYDKKMVRIFAATVWSNRQADDGLKKKKTKTKKKKKKKKTKKFSS
jgi:hypothetical protein